jgi:hypothetical protein
MHWSNFGKLWMIYPKHSLPSGTRPTLSGDEGLIDDSSPPVANIVDVELERLNLSTRARNCLRNAKISFLGELAALSAPEIMNWQNAGKKTLREIRELLGSNGLKLKGDQDTAQPVMIPLGKAGRDVQLRLLAPLSSFSLSTRAKNVIVQEKLRYLAELVQLDFGKLLAFHSSGKKTATELAKLVKAQGFELGTSIPDWSRETARALEESFASERLREIVKRSNAFLATLGPEPTCLEDELRRIAAALASDRNLELLIKLWGWNGSNPRTLESVAFELTPRLTRERVRQIEATALRRLRPFKFDTPHLRAAIALLRKAVPAIPADLAYALRQAGISRGDFSVASVKIAAKIIHLKWPLAEISLSNQRIFVLAEDEDRFIKILQIVRRRTSELGCLNIVSLASELQINEDRSNLIRRVLDRLPQIEWLDTSKDWLYLRDVPRNRLFNLCSKVLSVSPRIRLSELRRAVARSRRLSMAPPLRILGAFIEKLGLANINKEIAEAVASRVAVLNPESIEGKILAVFDEQGTVMDGEELGERCIAAGVNATSFYIYRLMSPVIASLGNGIYCKVGAEVTPGIIEDILSRRRRSTPRSSDHGWMINGNLWFGIELRRSLITTGGLRLARFVADLVQGEWTVQLPDGTTYDRVTCRDLFIWSFRKAFALLGAEPDDLMMLEFDKKTRRVMVRVGGPGLFEAMQEPVSLSSEDAGDDT